MMSSAQEDLSWLDAHVRASAVEMLQVLFSSSRISVVTFDRDGVIVGVNPQTAAFGGTTVGHYRGVNLLTHPILRRMGWTEALERVLKRETVELTDSRWVTLFTGEERYIDIIAGPVIAEDQIIGGVAYLIDSTKNHRAIVAEAASRKRARELEVFLARDVARLVAPLDAWSATLAPTVKTNALAMVTVSELSSLLDDLSQFVQLQTYKPVIEPVVLLDAVQAAGLKSLPRVIDPDSKGRIVAFADPRLLRRILSNLFRFSLRIGGHGWSIEKREGRVVLSVPVDGSRQLLEELLTATSLSATEADSAGASVAAARWMTEMMNGTLTVSDREPALLLSLPAADSELNAL
jgi:hypothetical protein